MSSMGHYEEVLMCTMAYYSQHKWMQLMHCQMNYVAQLASNYYGYSDVGIYLRYNATESIPVQQTITIML